MNPIYQCYFCGKEVERRKQGKPVNLHFCDNICKGNYQKTFKPVSKEWLYQKYVVEKLDCTQIGKIVKRDSKSVWNWLKDFNIPTRPRGSNYGQLPKGREPGFKLSEETKEKLSQIAKADGRMPFKKENGPPWRGKKGAQTPNWKGGITPDRQAFYQSEKWKEAQKKVYARDKKTCQRCGKKKKAKEPFDIHHIVSFIVYRMRTKLSNLILLCEACHYWVHGKNNINKEFLK